MIERWGTIIKSMGFFAASLAVVCLPLMSTQAEEFGGIQGVNISWSPDGKTLAFYSNYDGDNEIYLIDIDGTNIRQLTFNEIPDGMPAFTPEGNAVIYAAKAEAGWEIRSVTVMGGEPEVLIKSDEFQALWPNMAEDGRVVFTARPKEPEVEGDQDTFIWDPETGKISALIDTNFTDYHGRLSKDGEKLAFASNRSGRMEIYVAEADGRNPRQITRSPEELQRYGSASPVFSPDGHFLVYWGDEEGRFFHDHGHYVHDLETGETTALKKRILSTAYPSISPDGRKIAYVAAATPDDNSEFYIYVMDSAGQNHIRVWPVEEKAEFTEEELSVAKFWKDMGVVLREEGFSLYAQRYHPEFRHWDIERTGQMGTYESAINAWFGFHEAGHRITCTNVVPVSIDIVGDLAYARLIYEQTNTLADGTTITGVWRMFDVFKRYEDTWQVLESNMVKIEPDPEAMGNYRCLEK